MLSRTELYRMEMHFTLCQHHLGPEEQGRVCAHLASPSEVVFAKL